MKIYNGEKAIISLTSWKARINTVGKTLYSLLKMCPGFHIVLVLSEEEFPKKEEELPEELMLFVDNDLIEILWVYKNYKAFKKVLFTMDKYRDVPVISADDDCIYIINYAQELYDIWLNNKDSFITYRITKQKYDCIETWGFATLHPPFAYGEYGLFYIDYLEIKDNKVKISNLGKNNISFAEIYSSEDVLPSTEALWEKNILDLDSSNEGEIHLETNTQTSCYVCILDDKGVTTSSQVLKL